MFGLNPSTPRQVEQLQKFDDTKVVIRSRKSKGCSHVVSTFNNIFGFTTSYVPMQSVPITIDVVSSNLDQGEVYNIM
jgi:hypothetical protein